MTTSMKIPGYLFQEKIGAGAMGYVYRARQVSLDRPVAIKILSPTLSGDRSYISRFLRETRAVAKLRHENIVGGIDAGEINGVYYLIMEYVDGEPLKTILKREGKFTERRATDIVLQIARALRHIDEHAIVHRDVKPSNILLTKDGVAKLCDLGLAKNITIDPTVTMTGTSMGTPHYMSPEQARGAEDLDIRSDIYSLGATFYHAITGFTPFHAENPAALMAKHVGEALIPPIERNREISPAVNDIILKMLAKRRDDRYRTPADLIDALERSRREPAIAAGPAERPIVKRETTKGPRTTFHHRPPTTTTRRREIAAIAVVVGLILAGVAWFALVDDTSNTRDRRPDDGPNAGVAAMEAAHEQDRETYLAVRAAFVERRDPEKIPQIWKMLSQDVERYRSTKHSSYWADEMKTFASEIDAMIEPEWRPRRERAEALLAAGKLLDALVELEQFSPKHRYFTKEPKERTPSSRTRAGDEWERLHETIVASLTRRYDGDAKEVDDAIKAGQHFKAWNTSYDMELYVTPLTPGLKERLNELKAEIARRELQKMLDAEQPSFLLFDETSRRIEEITSANQGNPPLTDLLKKMRGENERRMAAYRINLRNECDNLYATFFTKYAWHLFLRDYPSARAETAALLERKTLGNLPSDVTETFFPKDVDINPVINILRNNDTSSTAVAADLSRLDEILREADPIFDCVSGFDLILDARAILLLEDLMEKSKIGLGYLQKSENEEPLNLLRQPVQGRTVKGIGIGSDPFGGGTDAILQFETSSDRQTVPFARKRGNIGISDEDMGRFARRSCAPSREAAAAIAPNDIRLNLQCGLLYLYAGLFADADRELHAAARAEGSFAERYINKSIPLRKNPPRLPRITDGESFKIDYTFARPEEAADWLQFTIPWHPGTIEARDGRLLCRGSIGLVWKCPVRNDVALEMDVTFLKGSELTMILHVTPTREDKTGYAALPFTTTDDEAYTHMILRQPINYSGMKMVRTTCISSPGVKLYTLKSSETYRLKIERRGETVTLFINGKKAAAGKDGSASSGLLGFRTYLTDIAVDNVRITGTLY